ncbi:MAG: tetratricopeptide repeat protein [Verrucomicrobiota bacterium]
MNRPPKKHKKTKDDIKVDPRFDREELLEADRKLKEADEKRAKAQGDDRNLVHVDEAFKDADLEDQVWLAWNKYKQPAIVLLLVILLGVVGVQGYNFYQERAVQSMQADFLAASTPTDLATFASDYTGTPLGGFAMLQTADLSYRESDYNTAASQYGEAATSIAGTSLEGRALLGQAMANLLAGNSALAQSQLSSLSSDGARLKTIRAEAIVNLGILAMSEGRNEDARRLFEQTKAIDEGYWAMQADTMLAELPEPESTAASIITPVTVEPEASTPVAD